MNRESRIVLAAVRVGRIRQACRLSALSLTVQHSSQPKIVNQQKHESCRRLEEILPAYINRQSIINHEYESVNESMQFAPSPKHVSRIDCMHPFAPPPNAPGPSSTDHHASTNDQARHGRVITAQS